MDLTVGTSITHDTFVIERTYATSPERVFAAFADPVKKRRWFVEGEGHDIVAFELNFKEGGSEHVSYRLGNGGPFEGAELRTDSLFQDIVPNRRIVIASTMDFGGQRISASLATFELLASAKGTSLVFTHYGAFFEGADGPKMRYAGWQKLLDRLATELAT